MYAARIGTTKLKEWIARGRPQTQNEDQDEGLTGLTLEFSIKPYGHWIFDR